MGRKYIRAVLLFHCIYYLDVNSDKMYYPSALSYRPAFAFVSANRHTVMHKYNHAAEFLSKLKKLILSFLFLICISPLIHSQQTELPTEYLSVEEGMPTRVNCILQDKIGFLWFATVSGLYKYDGYDFTSYKHDPNDTASLIDNNITTLYEDKEDVLWVGTLIGLEKFDRKINRFIHYKPNSSDTENNAGNIILAICEDKNSMLWIGTETGLYKFDKATEKFTYLKFDSTDSDSIPVRVQSIREDKEGALWFGTGRGLEKLDFKSIASGSTAKSKQEKFIHVWTSPKRNDLIYNMRSIYWIASIFIDEAGIFWLATNRGLVEFNPTNGVFYSYRFKSKDEINLRALSISQDVLSGNLWLATWSGLFSFNKKSKRFTYYQKHDEYCVYSERSGTLWIGTSTGIEKINRIKQSFKKYIINQSCYTVLNGTEGILWVKTTLDWYKKFDIRKEEFVTYSFGKDVLIYVFPEGDQIFRKGDGSLYIRDTLNKIQFFYNVSNINIGWFHSGCKTKRGYYTGNIYGSLYLFEPKTNRIKEIKNFKNMILSLLEDTHGLLWISTIMGLYCYNQEQDTINEFTFSNKILSKQSRIVINQIYEGKKGHLWFGTTAGLIMYERSTQGFIHFTEKEGLPNNNILGIVEDNDGYLWLNTCKGISKFDPETNRFKNYDASYGLEPPSNDFLGIGCKTKHGEIYFPSSKGITQFYPDSIKDNLFNPPVVITSFKKFDKPYLFSKEIRLPYDENFISFEFAALSYMSPERNQYAYKMEGVDEGWVYSGTRRYASYTNLDPGEYIFQVKGSNNQGVWNNAGASILIIISPPWWKTIYAYFFYSILFISVIYFSWKMHVKRIRMRHEYEMSRFEAEKLHEVDEMKSRFFTNISHEFRTPLTLIFGPARDILEKTTDIGIKRSAGVIRRNASRLYTLVSQLMDLSKLEAGKMKLEVRDQNIIPLLKELVLSFASLAEKKKITFKFSTAEEDLNVYIDKDKIEKIIMNLLSNAFKFTPEGGIIELKVSSNEGYVNISIQDTGVGIPNEKISKIFDRFYQVDGSHKREHEGTGIGLAISKELIELHKGKIKVESVEGKGTIFTISIPLGKKQYTAEEIYKSVKNVKIVTDFIPESILIEETENEKYNGHTIIDNEKSVLLLVEDNPDVRSYIRENMEKEHTIIEAVNGEEGLKASIEHIPDLIISDIMMPKMDGIEMCEKLKTDERTSHIPLILLTAKATSEDKITGYETGADDYIMKPFDIKELCVRIRNLIDQRKKLRNHFQQEEIFNLDNKNITSVDRKFLEKAVKIINGHLSDQSFGVESFASELSVGRTTLYKKLIAMVGEPPGDFIKRIRLSKASSLLTHKAGNIIEIALEVGFNNPAYFSECFKKQFGILPSQYQSTFTNH